MKLVGKDSFQDCLLTNFCSSDFIVLIYLVWKLSPRDTIQLEVSLSFKQILQLSTSLMMSSSTIVLSSFSGIALSAGNAAAGRGGEARNWGREVFSLEPLSYFKYPRRVYGEGLTFSCYGNHPPNSPLFYIQGLSAGKQQKQVQKQEFPVSGTKKKLLSEKCVINMTLCKEKYLFL